ncbi:MAG: hypothetical protein COB65_03970 [Thalassobium sp.]|nr:MAG: hypothetical protein COB65_03970 [Thalassobium sp.]
MDATARFEPKSTDAAFAQMPTLVERLSFTAVDVWLEFHFQKRTVGMNRSETLNGLSLSDSH